MAIGTGKETSVFHQNQIRTDGQFVVSSVCPLHMQIFIILMQITSQFFDFCSSNLITHSSCPTSTPLRIQDSWSLVRFCPLGQQLQTAASPTRRDLYLGKLDAVPALEHKELWCGWPPRPPADVRAHLNQVRCVSGVLLPLFDHSSLFCQSSLLPFFDHLSLVTPPSTGPAWQSGWPQTAIVSKQQPKPDQACSLTTEWENVWERTPSIPRRASASTGSPSQFFSPRDYWPRPTQPKMAGRGGLQNHLLLKMVILMSLGPHLTTPMNMLALQTSSQQSLLLHKCCYWSGAPPSLLKALFSSFCADWAASTPGGSMTIRYRKSCSVLMERWQAMLPTLFGVLSPPISLKILPTLSPTFWEVFNPLPPCPPIFPLHPIKFVQLYARPGPSCSSQLTWVMNDPKWFHVLI